MLGRTAVLETQLQTYITEQQKKLDERTAQQRNRGENIRLRPELHYDWVGNIRVMCRRYENGDPTRLDVFYGGQGRPDGDGHGHIVVSKGRITSWRLPADENGISKKLI